jgi:flagellar biosynthesis/type III secretory pathway chaperone
MLRREVCVALSSEQLHGRAIEWLTGGCTVLAATLDGTAQRFALD